MFGLKHCHWLVRWIFPRNKQSNFSHRQSVRRAHCFCSMPLLCSPWFHAKSTVFICSCSIPRISRTIPTVLIKEKYHTQCVCVCVHVYVCAQWIHIPVWGFLCASKRDDWGFASFSVQVFPSFLLIRQTDLAPFIVGPADFALFCAVQFYFRVALRSSDGSDQWVYLHVLPSILHPNVTLHWKHRCPLNRLAMYRFGCSDCFFFFKSHSRRNASGF